MEINPGAAEHRNKLIATIIKQYDEGAGGEIPPVVTLEDFFEFNWDKNSLAPNKVGYGLPPLAECYRILRDIRSRPEVQDVLVAIHETPEADEPFDADIWPDSDTIYVLTSASGDEVAEWASALHPDDIGQNWPCGTGVKPNAAPEVMPNVKVFALWWD